MLHTKYISCGPDGFREEDFLQFSHYKSMGANGAQGLASLDPRDLIGRIYVVDNYILLHTKYISSGPHGYREKLFKVFPIISLWQLMLPRVWPIRTLGAWLAGFM